MIGLDDNLTQEVGQVGDCVMSTTNQEPTDAQVDHILNKHNIVYTVTGSSVVEQWAIDTRRSHIRFPFSYNFLLSFKMVGHLL